MMRCRCGTEFEAEASSWMVLDDRLKWIMEAHKSCLIETLSVPTPGPVMKLSESGFANLAVHGELSHLMARIGEVIKSTSFTEVGSSAILNLQYSTGLLTFLLRLPSGSTMPDGLPGLADLEVSE